MRLGAAEESEVLANMPLSIWFPALAAALAASCTRDCDQPPYFYARDRCPRTLNDNDRVSISVDPVRLVAPYAAADAPAMGEGAATEADELGNLAVVEFEVQRIRHTEDEDDEDQRLSADHIWASISVRGAKDEHGPLSSVGAPCSTFGERDLDCDGACDSPSVDPASVVRMSPVLGDADPAAEEADATGCKAASESALDCVTGADGSILVELSARPTAAIAAGEYFVVFESGRECRAAPLSVTRGAPAGAVLTLSPVGGTLGQTACGDVGASACWEIPVAQSEGRCDDPSFACDDPGSGVPIRIGLATAVGEPIPPAVETPVLLEVRIADTNVAPEGQVVPLVATLSTSPDCVAASANLALQLDRTELVAYLCTNGATGVVDLTARVPADAEDPMVATASFRITPLPSQLAWEQTGSSNGTSTFRATVHACDGTKSAGAPISISAVPESTPLTLPGALPGHDAQVDQDGGIEFGVQVAVDQQATVTLVTPESGLACHFTVVAPTMG